MAHVHSLIRLDTKGLPTHGFRYECVKCGARLRKQSGVMIEARGLQICLRAIRLRRRFRTVRIGNERVHVGRGFKTR